MENLFFSIEATLPIFIMMMLGVFLKKIKVIDEEFAKKLNKFVFAVPLPVLVFRDLQSQDFTTIWNGKFVLFCFIATALSIAIAFLLSAPLKRSKTRGEFIQVAYRSSAALIGIAFIQNLYGNASIAALMIVGSVPLYNVMAVIVLSVFGSERNKVDARLIRDTFFGILKNPIIIGVAVGILYSALKLPMPKILYSTLSSIGAMATPLGLIAMGASFELRAAVKAIRPAAAAAFMKLIGFAMIFLPIAVFFGFRGEELATILVMLGSATTVACYVMAKNYGHEGSLTSNTVMLTTLFSSFTLTGWLFLLKTMRLI